MTVVAYFHNLSARAAREFEDGDTIVFVATAEVPECTLAPEDWAFAHFNWVDHIVPELHDNEAPSMSTGDIVLVGKPNELRMFACARIGWHELTAEELGTIKSIERRGRTIREVYTDLEALEATDA